MHIRTIVISVSLHMSVITQDGDSVLMMAVREGKTEVVSLLLEAGVNAHLQNKVYTCWCTRESSLGGNIPIYNLNRVVCEVT